MTLEMKMGGNDAPSSHRHFDLKKVGVVKKMEKKSL